MKSLDIPAYFTSRQTIRKFSNREVGTPLLRSVIEAAMRAPTCGNMQLYSVIISRAGDSRKALEATHFNQPAAVGAPVILTVCADFNRFTRWCKLRNADSAYDNMLSFQTAATDAVIFAQQITTIAEMAGLGCCWLGTVSYNSEKTAELLGLPELVFPVASLAIGWPDETPQQCERLDVDAVMYEEKYPDLSDSAILEIYKGKEEFPANAGFAAENGKENLAKVFAEVRYPRSVNEPVSEAMLSHLKKAGFM